MLLQNWNSRNVRVREAAPIQHVYILVLVQRGIFCILLVTSAVIASGTKTRYHQVEERGLSMMAKSTLAKQTTMIGCTHVKSGQSQEIILFWLKTSEKKKKDGNAKKYSKKVRRKQKHQAMLVSNIPPATAGDDDENSIVAAIEMENCGIDIEQVPQKSVCHETMCKAEIDNEIQSEGECSNALQEVAFLGTASLNEISDVQDMSKEADNHTVTILNLQEQVIALRKELCQMQQMYCNGKENTWN